jgi:dTDP-4-dehydrorhamnose reductase
MTRPLIVGSEGLLGRALAKRLEEAHPETISSTREFLDITDYFGICSEFERLEPTVVINTAAFSDVDGCELDPIRALQVNKIGAHNLARACKTIGARFIHISTDYVFDGTKTTPYVEEDATSPIQVYGASKLDGETAILAELPGALIVRTSFLFGPGRPTFVDRAIERARKNDLVRAVLDWVNSPTYTVDLAEMMVALIARDVSGVLHASNAGACSKFEFARAACGFAGIEDPSIAPIRRADLPLPAKRPERTPFDLTRLTAVLGRAPRSWEEALEDYLVQGESGEDDVF